MPPATATAFQYTPPSYLLRATDTTNRPWNSSKTNGCAGAGAGVGVGVDDNNSVGTGTNEYDLAQEDRPQTRRESHLDAHFQQRVRTKQSRYRNFLKGEGEGEDNYNNDNNNNNNNKRDGGNNKDNDNDNDDDDDDSILLAVANADSYADVHSAKLHVQSASNNEMARKNRKERMTGHPEPPKRQTSTSTVSSTASDAETARSLRAHRLRSSLLKQTPDEFDVQTKLEMRRLARKDEETAARRAEQEAALLNNNSNSNSNSNDSDSSSPAQQRQALEKERLALQKEREALVIAKEEAAWALLKAAELNEERRRQRELDAVLEADRWEEERMSKRREQRSIHNHNKNNKQHEQQHQHNSHHSRNSQRRERSSSGYKKRSSGSNSNSNRSMKTKSYNDNASNASNMDNDGETFMTEFDVENDFAFLHDLQGIIRDTGLLKSCVTGCFGDDNTLTEGICIVNDNNDNNNNNGNGNNKKGVTTATATMQSRTQSAMSAVSSIFMPDLAPSSDNSASDDEYTDNINNNNNNNTDGSSIRRSRVYAKYRA